MKKNIPHIISNIFLILIINLYTLSLVYSEESDRKYLEYNSNIDDRKLYSKIIEKFVRDDLSEKWYYDKNEKLVKIEAYSYGKERIYRNDIKTKEQKLSKNKSITFHYRSTIMNPNYSDIAKIIRIDYNDNGNIITVYNNKKENKIQKKLVHIIYYKDYGDTLLQIDLRSEGFCRIGSKLKYSLKDVHYIENFYVSDNFKFDKAIVALGKIKEGFRTAIIFPENFYMNDKIKIDHIFFHYPSNKFNTFLLDKIVKNKDYNTKDYYLRALKLNNKLYSRQLIDKKYLDINNNQIFAYIDSKKGISFSYINSDNSYKDFIPYYFKNVNNKIRWEEATDIDILPNGIFNVWCRGSEKNKINLQKWIEPRKKAFTFICNYLGVKWKYGVIRFIVYKRNGKYKIVGSANPSKNMIQTYEDQTYGHELTHVISYRIRNGKRIKSALINEGLATMLSMRTEDFNFYHAISKKYLEDKELTANDLLNKHFREDDFRYFIGASFVFYLIENYTKDKFKEFFAQEDYDEVESFNKYYNKSYKTIFNEWINYIKNEEFNNLSERDKKLLNKHLINYKNKYHTERYNPAKDNEKKDKTLRLKKEDEETKNNKEDTTNEK